MRFKAKLSPHHVDLLHNVIAPISRLHGHDSSSDRPSNGGGTFLYLDQDKLVLSTKGGSNNTASTKANTSSSLTTMTSHSTAAQDAEGILCFAELTTKNGVFREHVIESLAKDNSILMELCLVQLRTVLKGILVSFGAKNTKGGPMGSIYNVNAPPVGGWLGPEVTMKLAKRNGGLPHLCLEVKDVGRNGIGVHHAIPVKILNVQELQYHTPPRLGMPDVQLELPKDRPLKSVIERLRTISPQVYVEGSMSGVLVLRIEGEGASIRTSYNNLVPLHDDCKSSQLSQDPNQDSATAEQQAKCTLKIDSKKLHASLHWQGTLAPKDVSMAVLCMWENEMLVLDVSLNPEIGRFMYYVPVHYISDDWD